MKRVRHSRSNLERYLSLRLSSFLVTVSFYFRHRGLLLGSVRVDVFKLICKTLSKAIANVKESSISVSTRGPRGKLE